MKESRLLCTAALLAVALAVAGTAPAAAIVDGDGLEVSVGAETTIITTYLWDIDKSADQTALTIEYGDEEPVNYSVTVNIWGYDEDYWVAGNIHIYNPGPGPVDIAAISATISPSIAASVDCGITYPYTLNEYETLTCAYSAELPDDSNRTVTVDVTANGDSSVGGAGVDFSGATLTEVDTCVDVVDSWDGYLGFACVEDVPATFYYTRMIGGCIVCGYREVTNYAYFTTNDTDATGCDGWAICVFTPCGDGCTRTFGYWKTHSEFGPAPYDDTWAELPDGANTDFFLSGQSYYEVLLTSPRGNAYYILAHQWIAAQLNVMSGASIPGDVLAAWLAAKDLFEMYGPGDVTSTARGRVPARTSTRVVRTGNSNGLRGEFIELAEILDDYNNGYLGPGHCPD